MGVPEIVQVVGERTRPAGRLMADASSHDEISVPSEQSMSIGDIDWPRVIEYVGFSVMMLVLAT